MIDLPKQTFGACDGKPLPKPKRETREQAKAAKRAEIDGIKREAEKKAGVKRSRPSGPSERTKLDVLKRDGHACLLCGRGVLDGVKLQVDHIHPVAACGMNNEGNLATLCEEHNRAKGARMDLCDHLSQLLRYRHIAGLEGKPNRVLESDPKVQALVAKGREEKKR